MKKPFTTEDQWREELDRHYDYLIQTCPHTGDLIAVEANQGYIVGRFYVSLDEGWVE